MVAQVAVKSPKSQDQLVIWWTASPLYGAIVAPIQDIRNILYERMPNFNTLSLDFAGVGAGNDPGVVIENITVHSSAKDGRQLPKRHDGRNRTRWHAESTLASEEGGR